MAVCGPLYTSDNYTAGKRFLTKTREHGTFARVYINMQCPEFVMKVMLDLFSGLGGASEAFVQAGWRVIRVESNPELAYVPHTLTLDCLEWADWIDNLPPIDLIWASPPCQEFSLAYNAPAAKAQREGRRFNPDMRCVNAALDIIEALEPRHWIIENVHGSVSHFAPLLGRHTQKCGPCYLWGNFPWLNVPKTAFQRSKTQNMTGSQNRSLIPFELSFALLDSIRTTRYLEDWC